MVMFADDVEKGKEKKREYDAQNRCSLGIETQPLNKHCKTNASSVFIKCQSLYACYWEYN